MSRWYENECVGCPPNMGCMGDSCPNRHVLHIECDECHDEFYEREIIEENGKDYCEDCYAKLFGEEEEEDE